MSINDDGTIARLERERREIIALYDKGVDTNQSKEIPASKIDKYGFFIINDSAAKLSSKDQKKISKSERKWNKMMKNYNVARKYHKFVPRTFKGIPESQRSLVWYKLLDIQILKSTNKGMYLRMRQRGRWKSPEIRQIDLDVNRTFRLNSYFYQRYCQRQQMLFNVLAAYSAYNSEVGYCQGMNNLAAIFTMYLAEEEDVFWGLSQLLTGSKWRMHGFFISGFPKFVRFEKIFNKIISQLLSSLKTHMI
ncbi:hypothetical protein GJ496_007375 [Pomphorhynchus laevis]|nr:hypothetical protein GJ496_007375 [Pomphorhynchus laevis]